MMYTKPVKKSKKLHKKAASLFVKGKLSEYENIRMGNNKDRQEMLMADFTDFNKDLVI